MLAALPAGAAERTDPFRVCFFVAGAEVTPWIDAFTAEMAKLGYAIGNNWRFERVNLGGDTKRLPEAAAEVLALHPDVILVSATPTLMALAKQHATIPVVFVIGVDPVGLGIVQSLAHPGGNFTGMFNNGGDHLEKNVQLMRELLPQGHRLAFYVDASFGPAINRDLREKMTAAANEQGLEPKFFEVRSGEELPAAFDQMDEFKADGLIMIGGPVWAKNRLSIIGLTRSHRLPTIYPWRLDPADGGLMSYGSDMEGQFRRAANHVDKILRGANPADLPVEQATTFKFVINLRTARELGVEVPPLLLSFATELIE
jgi:putative ABC transport system substrate-binding protein